MVKDPACVQYRTSRGRLIDVYPIGRRAAEGTRTVEHLLVSLDTPPVDQKFTATAAGFGEGQPVATNDTAPGRQQNRRVELVVSGDIIGRR